MAYSREVSRGIARGVDSATNVVGDPYYLAQAHLVLDAKEGALAAGGAAAVHLDGVATWENQAATKPNYLHLPGVAANYASVPDAANLDGFVDFTLQVDDVTVPDWTPSAANCLISKYSTSQVAWRLDLQADGTFRLYTSADGSAETNNFSAATGLGAGATASVRVLRVGELVRFYLDSGSGFALLGSESANTVGTLHGSSAKVEVGMRSGGGYTQLEGSIGRARVWSDATQTTNVLDIDFSKARKGDTSFTCISGQTVTINSTAINTPAAIRRASGSDARQVTASTQGKLLTPSAGNLPAAHFPGVGGNFYSVPDAADLDGFTSYTVECKGVTLSSWTPSADQGLAAKWTSSGSQRSWRFQLTTAGNLVLYTSFDGSASSIGIDYESDTSSIATGLSAGATADLMVVRDVSVPEVRFYVNGVQLGSGQTCATTACAAKSSVTRLGMAYNTTGKPLTGKMTRARVWNSAVAAPANPTETPVLDINFELDATHGAASFTPTIGGTVTTTTNYNNPCRVIGYPVVRTDGSDDYMHGMWAENLTPGRYFMVATRLGDGGESSHRIFNTWTPSGIETGTAGFIHSYQAGSYYASDSTFFNNHLSLGTRYLRELKCSTSAQSVLINGANALSDTNDMSAMSSTHYGLMGNYTGTENGAIDIEFLGLYPITMTDEEAAELVITLNRRFNIY